MNSRQATRPPSRPGLDQQLAELLEVVCACERRWALEDRIEAAIKEGRSN